MERPFALCPLLCDLAQHKLDTGHCFTIRYWLSHFGFPALPRAHLSHMIARLLYVALLTAALSFASSSSPNCFGQATPVTDYTALGDPSYATRLRLSDQQAAEVKTVLTERREAILAAAPDKRADVIAATNEKLKALLTDAQRSQFTELVTGNKLRFTFRNESWAEVLSWFASQADLALVMNEAPTGAFSYSDSKNHTTSEAIDLLNGVLQSKGFTLVRRDKMLIVSSTKDGVAYDQVPKIAPDKLASRGRFEFVSVIFPLDGRPVENVLKEVSALLGTNGRATPLPATGQLMIVDTAGRVADIRKLIESIPKKKAPPKKKEPAKPKKKEDKKKPPPPPSVFQVHSSVGLDVDRTIEVLRKLYGDKTPITGDAKADQITAFTSAKTQEAITKTLAQMKVNVSGDNKPRLKTYSIVNQDLEQLKTVLAQANPGIQISEDATTSRLFVVADVEQHRGVAQTLETLNAVEANGSESVQVFDVRQELVDQVVELVKPLVPRASVVANGSRVAVRGSAQDLEIAKSAIAQLDAAEQREEKPTLRFLKLKQKLESSYFDSLKQLAPDARISNVPNRNQIAIVATDSDYARLVASIEQIERETTEATAREMRRLAVNVEDSNRFLSLLKKEFSDTQMMLNENQDELLFWPSESELPNLQKRIEELLAILPAKQDSAWKSYSAESLELSDMQTLLKPVARKAQFKPEPQRKRMMIWAAPAEHEKIAQTLAAFQGDDTTKFKDVLLGYPVNRGDVAAVVSMLQTMRPDVKFAADETANRILVTAPLAEQARIKGIIDQLDTAPGEATGDVIKRYTVQSVEPATVIQLMQSSLPKLRMTPNRQSIAAVGSAQDHKKLAEAIKEFDENPEGKSVVAYNVGTASASQVSSILRQLIRGVSVSANESRQTVVVWGSEADHVKAKQAVEQFTKEGASQRTTEVYRLDRTSNASAERVFERLAPRARVSRVYGTNSVVATATEEEHAMFRDVILKMKGSDGPTIMKVYAIDKERLNVDDVLDSLDESLRSRVGIRMNEQLNSLIVRGSEDDHLQMKQLIDDLEASLPEKEQRVTEVYRLSHADPDTAHDLLRNLFRDANFAEDDDLGTLAAVALPKEHKEIAKIIEQIDLPGQQTQLKTEIYRFDRTSARAAEDAFDRLAPRARVRYLSGSNSVIATATEADHKLFREIAEKMNGDTSQSETKVYALDKKQINVDDVLASIDDTLRSRMSLRMNEQTNSLIVRGSAKDQATMSELIEEIKAKIPPQNQRVAKIYRFENGNADQASDILRDLFDDVRVTSNGETGTVAVTALPEEHERIAQVVEQMDVPGQKANRTTEFYPVGRRSGYSARDAFERMAPRARVSYVEGSNSLMATATEAEHVLFREAAAKMTEANEDRFAKIYTFEHASARYARYALREMFEDASITYDYDNGALYATATEEEHKQIEGLVKQMDVPKGNNSTTKVYRINTASAGQIYPAISSMVDDGRVTYDSDSNVLIVTATSVEHKEVEKVLKDLDNVQGDDASTQVYALKSANPANIQTSLERLMPQIRVASDPASSSLIVSANESDHKRVASLVQQLDNAPGQESQMKAYSVKSDNARQIFDSLTRTFNGNGNFSISFQEPTNTIFVVATPKNQSIFSQLMQQLDKPELAVGGERTAQTYGLTNLSGNSARNAINGLLQGTSPPPTIEIDDFGSSLILVGTKEQHERVAGTLGNLAGEDSELEVFDLEYVDPWTVESAVDSLYANQPASSAPTMTSDYFSSRLFVRGNQKQIDQVRTLLSKMGETSVMPREENGGGDVRTIPFRGDVAAAVEQIQSIWPRMRKNKIEVVAPADPTLQIDEPVSTPLDNSELNPIEPADDEDNNSVLNDSHRTHFVAVQVTTRAPAEQDNQASPPTESEPANVADENKDPAPLAADTPIVIVPEQDQITIASTDHEALDQLEELFRAISRSDDEDRTSFGSDFAVFLLRNTGASEMRQLLGDLFEQLRKNDSASSSEGGLGGRDGRPGPPSGFGFGNIFGPTFGNVAVVADDRLNALIIHGDREERELIRELLRVLDTKELANPIVVHQPELLRLENTQADRVLGILQNVYKSQLQSGGGRRKVEIPEGVSPEVASVLQQINAAAGAPVLTLDVDATTNSIVMRAPPELRQEIQTFVSSLDAGAGKNRSRNVRVIRLRRGKSDQIRDALREFILERSGSRSSSN